MAGTPGRYWPEQMNRFHPYGRRYGRGRVQLTDKVSPGARGSGPEPPLGFMVDRSAAPPAPDPQSTIHKINFVAQYGQRLTHEFLLYVHNLPPVLLQSVLDQAVRQQLAPYGPVSFVRNQTRTSMRIKLVNHASRPEFDPTSPACQSLLLDDASYPFTPVFRDVRKRLLRTQIVDYKQIEAHIVLAESFDQQVHQIRSGALMSEEDLKLREELRLWFEHLLNFKGYNCSVHAIGSSATGLGLRDGDLDILINLTDYDMKYEAIERMEAVNLLTGIRQILVRDFNMHILRVINARCPIIKLDFSHIPHNTPGLQCDISISNVLATYCTNIMKHFFAHEPLFWDLAALIKYWLSARSLIGPNQITSYGCLLMVIFYLQSVHVLPSLYHMQFTVRQDLLQNRWNAAFDPNPSFFTYAGHESLSTDPSAGDSEQKRLRRPLLSSLLLGFFNFYAKFPFGKKVICPHYGTTREKGDLFMQHELRITDFSIQDLIQLNSNIGQNMTQEFFRFFRNLFKLVDHLIASLKPSLSDDDAAKKILVKMIESVDDKMVDEFDVTTTVFQDQAMPHLMIKQTTIDVTQAFVKTWSVRSMDIVEETLRDVLTLTEFKRVDLFKADSPPTHQSYIGQFLVVIRGSEHAIWQKRIEVRKLLKLTTGPDSADFVDEEKQVTQKIREEMESDDDDVEVDIAVSDDDVVCVTEQTPGLSDVSLSFKLLINFSCNTQLLELRFEKEAAAIPLTDKRQFWERECKIFLSNYLLQHVQHAYKSTYS